MALEWANLHTEYEPTTIRILLNDGVKRNHFLYLKLSTILLLFDYLIAKICVANCLLFDYLIFFGNLSASFEENP